MDNLTKDKALTNEKIKAKFESPFELVGYAIALVTNMVLSGRAPLVKTNVENPAVIALDEISQGKDAIQPLPEPVVLVSVAAAVAYSGESEMPRPMKKEKPRRIL